MKLATTERMFNEDDNIDSLDKQINQLKPIVSQSSWFNQIFTFHQVKMYFNFLKSVKISTCRKYIPEFQPMIKSTYIWQKCLAAKGDIDFFWEIIKSQKKALIGLFIFGILSGLTFLVGIYLQFYLFDAIRNNEREQAWKFGGIMLGAMVLKNFLFSYTERISNNISINFKIHMENTLIKSLLEVGSVLNRQQLENLYFYNIPIIRQLILFIPYLLSTGVQIVGAIVFIFVFIGRYGLISLSMLILMFIILAIIFYKMYQIMIEAKQITDKRSIISSRNFRHLIQISYQGMTNLFYGVIDKLRKLQARLFGKYSLLYSIAQMVGDAYPTITIIIFYTIARDQELSQFQYSKALRIASFLGTMYFPIRIQIFGATIILSSIKSIRQLKKALIFKQIVKYKDETLSYHNEGLMADDLGSCYRTKIDSFVNEPVMENVEQTNQRCGHIQLTITNKFNEIRKGQTILITGRADCRPSTEEYLQQMIKCANKVDKIAVISRIPFVMEASIRDNIVMFSEFYEPIYEASLKISGIYELVERLQEKDKTLLSANSVKYFKWLSFRIQLARALYHDVSILAINRGLTYSQEHILRKVFLHRKKRGHTNIIINNAINFMDEIDYVIFLQNNGELIKGTPFQLSKNPLISFSNDYYVNKIDLLKENKNQISYNQTISNYIKVQVKDIIPPSVGNSKALAIMQHQGAFISFLILGSIFISAFFKQYIGQLVPLSNTGTAPHTTLYIRMLYSCITFLVLVIVRGLILTYYFTQSSTSLSTRLFNKFYHLTIGQIFRLYNRRQTTNTQVSISNLMNENWLRDTETGFFVFYEIISLITLTIIKSYIMVAISPLFLMGLVTSTIIYIITITKILNLKHSVTNSFNLFVIDIIANNKSIINYKKSKIFFQQFVHKNKSKIIFDLNQIWALIGQRFINQLICILFFIIVLVVMIQGNFDKNKNRTYSLLMTSSLGLITEVSNNVRYFLKLKRHFQLLLIGVAQVLKVIEDQPVTQIQSEHFQKKPIYNFKKIQFQDLTLNVLNVQICRRVNFQLSVGDRVVVIGQVTYGKSWIFGILHNIYDHQSIQGRVLIDSVSYKQCDLQVFNVINTIPIFPAGLTVFQIMKIHRQNITVDEIETYISMIFQFADLQKTFSCQTNIDQLCQAERDILAIVEKTMVRRCQMLLINQALVSLDKKSLTNILNYLISRREIKVIVHITNHPLIIPLYKRKFQFFQNTIREIR